MTVQLHRLEGFYRVARAGGFSRAAREFPYPITQPGVHQQVRRLEEELGVRLLKREARDRMVLTPAGSRLYRFCEPFFEELPRVLRLVAAGEYGGVVRIDAAGLILRQLLPEWMRALQRSRPDVMAELEEIQVPDLARLRTGAADLIIDHFESPPAGFESRHIATARTYVIVPSIHFPQGRRTFRPESLRSLPLVAYHPALPQHAVQLAAVRARIGEPVRMVSATSADSILALVAAGLGYSVIPWLETKGPRTRGVTAYLQRGPGTEHFVYAVWQRTDPPNPLVRAVLSARRAA